MPLSSQNNTWMLDAYRQMLRIRLLEEEIALRYHEQEMRCPVHLSIGQEAVAVGVCLALKKTDYVVSTHRSHAHYLAKGGDLLAMLLELYGREGGCSGGMGGSMHLIDEGVGFMGSTAIVGNSIPIGVGLALAADRKGEARISCIFLGDGAIEEGVFYEAANFAAIHSLPVLFVCENNLYSVYSGLEVRQPQGRKIYKMVEGLGVSAQTEDGNNVKCVFDMVSGAVEQIRMGSGPYFLEFSTYRWREHCGPNYDNDLGYRSIDEFEQWKAREPILACRQVLLESFCTEEQLEEIGKHIKNEIDAAFEKAKKAPFPDASKAFALEYKGNMAQKFRVI